MTLPLSDSPFTSFSPCPLTAQPAPSTCTGPRASVPFQKEKASAPAAQSRHPAIRVPACLPGSQGECRCHLPALLRKEAEIETIKLAEQKRKAERRRRATVVVGDLQPLRDALPELLELEAGGRRPRARGVSSRPRPTELSRMSAAQRLELLEEERARFRELLASPAYRASPLLAIGQQLAQQMQLDGGSQL
ncbi:hypothetical protein GH733_016843 [Mirounga leonina]|nr:hypothetical protein GH733_016843 [Mirounga leonina]